jgi:16S rRNA (guanine966-N2)-methyltransferase
MRIIGGEHRGRRLSAPAGLETRPMLDRVREALFSTLAAWWEGAFVLDLFAGSGSLGLEALSRGASFVRFVEKSPRAAAHLARNLAELELEARAEIVRADALAHASWGERAADVVFLDPPYALLEPLETRRKVFAAVEALGLRFLAPEGVLVFHAPRGVLSPGEFGTLLVRERNYGSNALWYAQRSGEPAESAGGER